jgi:hypothetical protein
MSAYLASEFVFSPHIKALMFPNRVLATHRPYPSPGDHVNFRRMSASISYEAPESLHQNG